MHSESIPNWDGDGVIPPMDPRDPMSSSRSPYRASLVDVMERFGNSAPRRDLLSGFLGFRAELHQAGLVRGFQRIDGSFVENVEMARGRAPGDVDVATFFHVPDGYTEESFADAYPDFFNPSAMKRDFGVDAYLAAVNLNDLEMIVRRAAYWHDIWSHTRDGGRKGYLQVDLDPREDESARAALDRINGEDGGLT